MRLFIGCLTLTASLAGCSDIFGPEPIAIAKDRVAWRILGGDGHPPAHVRHPEKQATRFSPTWKWSNQPPGTQPTRPKFDTKKISEKLQEAKPTPEVVGKNEPKQAEPDAVLRK